MRITSMAWRNVWRNTRRSVVTIGAMTFALWVMILYSGMVEGYLRSMEESILELEVGDLQVHRTGYLDNPTLWDVVERTDEAVASLESQGFKAAPRWLGGGLGASGEASAGVSIRGIDVARDASVLSVSEHLTRGTWLDPSDPHGVVVGRRLAKSLAADIGAELLVLSQAIDGSTANDLYTVRGILGPVSDGTDRTAVFMTGPAFQDLMSMGTDAHQIIARRPDGVELADAAAMAQAALPQLDVRSWEKLMPMIASMLESSRAMIVFVFLIVYLAIGILILNAVLMAVYERIREFGVLKAIGVGPWSVLGLILTETAIQVGIAVSLGVLFAVPGVWFMTNVGINMGAMSVMGVMLQENWLGVYGPEQFIVSIGVLLVIVFPAALVPAIKAARLEPVDAMRYQ